MLRLPAHSSPSHCPPPRAHLPEPTNLSPPTRAHQEDTPAKISAPTCFASPPRFSSLITVIPLSQPWISRHQPKSDRASWQWATQPVVSSNIFQTSTSIISHHHKNSQKGSRQFMSIFSEQCHPHGPEAGVCCTSCNSSQEENQPSHSSSVQHDLLQICEIAFCLIAFFGTMMTLAPIYCRFCFWLCHKIE